ncbi:hypothetical protein [Deinococcus cellulosilyticus]|uniref:Uncharacterized protein n=1 Tax=Deinococcus cellulosilyticus (strain DSM 18568 / NBRC 106333 / KACC 11606 / 5516J-15) TaxID=1223518 RepID=A0A511MYH3_DEIC1|nr:hypothetical protein [Deinococcus cellulosilyticus]GEM45609.1 hypothetical protein DC3_12440 [Deinococcus cellulosilyticus NBRC 106333 = KACC 11606]
MTPPEPAVLHVSKDQITSITHTLGTVRVVFSDLLTEHEFLSMATGTLRAMFMGREHLVTEMVEVPGAGFGSRAFQLTFEYVLPSNRGEFMHHLDVHVHGLRPLPSRRKRFHVKDVF